MKFKNIFILTQYKSALVRLEDRLKSNDVSNNELTNQYKELEEEIERLNKENEELRVQAGKAGNLIIFK